MSVEATTRNQQIVADRKAGRKSLGQLAKEHNISRERVRQISERGGVSNEQANAAYKKHREKLRQREIESHAGAVMMLYISGKTTTEIGEQLGIAANLAQEVINEHLTDEVIASRSANLVKLQHPDSAKRTIEPRDDRFWTQEKVLAALVKLARSNNGRLMSSIEYQKLSPKRDDLPSFATARNRLGRWSSIRVQVNDALKG